MHFFATRDDLLAVVDHVEGIAPLDYVLMGHRPRPAARRWWQPASQMPVIERLSSLREVAKLGTASRDAAVACERYLVAPRGGEIRPRLIRSTTGEVDAYDQLHNADTIVVSPGGRWNDGVLLHGRVSTVSDSPIARTLLRRFESSIRKRFEKIGVYRVGPEAGRLLDAGWRLCMAVQSPPSHDLRRPD